MLAADKPIFVPQIVDGFSYNSSMLWVPGRFFPNALAQLDILRRAANYRPRWWTIPEDITTSPIAPYDTLYYQLNVPDGSYLWGYNYAGLYSAEITFLAAAITTAVQTAIQVTSNLSPTVATPFNVVIGTEVMTVTATGAGGVNWTVTRGIGATTYPIGTQLTYVVAANDPYDACITAVDSCSGIPLFQDFANGNGLSINGNSRMSPCILTQPRLILDPGLVNVEIANRTGFTLYCQLLLHFAEPCVLICEEERQREWAARVRTGGAR